METKPKWAVAGVCDQTIAYYTEDGSETTVHHEAFLFDDEQLALATATKQNEETKEYFEKNGYTWHGDRYWVERVDNILEFITREDTW